MSPRCLRLNGLTTSLPVPAVMGILNLTPDSFSDGGKYNTTVAALARARELLDQGASILDLGAESTRPGSEPISAAEELDRLLPVLEGLPKGRFLVSVDSYKLEVQAEAIRAGVHIINDIYGGSKELYRLAEKHRCGLVIMHTPGPPDKMQWMTDYGDGGVVRAVQDYFIKKHETLAKYDIPRYWVDPGIGFGKTLLQNAMLMGKLSKFCGPGHGVLLGASRKSWLEGFGGSVVANRLGGSLAAAAYAARQGAEIIRAHDVKETVQALAVDYALEHICPKTGRLQLEGIQVRTQIGINKEEKVAEQGIFVSVGIEGDFSAVVRDDSLEAGTDYVDVINEVRDFCSKHRGNTLEHLADKLALHLKWKFRAEAVELTIDKPRYTGKLELSAIRFHVRR